MTTNLNSHQAIVRAARLRRSLAISHFWRKLADTLSPRLPKILQHED